jgi:hypothetical protein
VTVNPQNVLKQAKRYLGARGCAPAGVFPTVCSIKSLTRKTLWSLLPCSTARGMTGIGGNAFHQRTTARVDDGATRPE